MKRIVITIVFVIATIATVAGIISNYEISRPAEQFPVIGQTAERTN